MARTALTAQDIVSTGLDPTFSAANADGHSIRYDPRVFLVVKQGAGARVVTVKRNRVVDGVTLSNQTVNVPENDERWVKLTEYKVQSDGTVHVDFDAVTNTTVAAIRLPA